MTAGSDGEEVSAEDVCVLMPVYGGTPAPHLERALTSLRGQTQRAGAVVLVQDGDLTDHHLSVIAEASRQDPGLRVIRPGKVGLVGALNAGLAATAATWVARMDADDVAEPERLESQIRAAAVGDVDVIGSAMWEFESDPDHCTVLRKVPLTHDEIVRALPTVNPVNHPTVLMRRTAVVDVGGYVPLAGMEDYHLWARLAAAGARFRNLPEPLVRYRVDHRSYQRRADWAAVRAEWVLQQHLRRLGLVGPVRSAASWVMRVTFRLLPPGLMRPAYAVVRSILARRSRAAQ